MINNLTFKMRRKQLLIELPPKTSPVLDFLRNSDLINFPSGPPHSVLLFLPRSPASLHLWKESPIVSLASSLYASCWREHSLDYKCKHLCAWLYQWISLALALQKWTLLSFTLPEWILLLFHMRRISILCYKNKHHCTALVE